MINKIIEKMTLGEKVWLVNHHDNFPGPRGLVDQEDIVHYLEGREGTTRLTKGMLNQLIVNIDHPSKAWDIFYASALCGLSMDGFIILVSLGVEDGKITFHEREWCEIYLEATGELVLRFSHYTNKADHPFHNLMEWLEEKRGKSDIRICVEKWNTPKKWRDDFFVERIQDEVDRLRDKANHLENEGKGLHHQYDEAYLLKGRAERIQALLPPR